jgi:hypothetical protein
MDVNLLVALVILALLIAIGAAVLARRTRSRRLAQRFGPEYQRLVRATGSRGRAEAELAAREQRVAQLEIVPLQPHEAQRFRADWQALQARFVDHPRTAVGEADLLVRDVMLRRGYPVADFDTRAADISVHHPRVVEHYRAAHAIALRDREGRADTEALRQALVHYRALFGELLEAPQPEPAARRAEPRRAEEPRRATVLRPQRAMAKDAPTAAERERHRER